MIPAVSFGRHTLNQIENGITKEWIETNGLGSYAMGSVAGANTRRYHALYVLTLNSALERRVLINRVEESVMLRNRRYDCSCQEYPGTISPQGYLYLESFSYDPFPRWTFSIDDLKIEKSFFLRSGEDIAVLRYRHVWGPSVKILLSPFLSCRDQHQLIRADGRFQDGILIHGHQVRCAVRDNPVFYITAVQKPSQGRNGLKVVPESNWYKNLVYAEEEEMDKDFKEDLFVPCQVQAELGPDQEVALIFSTIQEPHIDLDRWVEQEGFLRKKGLESLPLQGPFAKRCAIAADQFVVRIADGTYLLRGYPWHDLTTREAMQSLPGLCLATGRKEEAREVLLRTSRMLHQGLLPRRFGEPDPAQAEYTGMDAPLWFIWAAQKFWEGTKEASFLKEVQPAVEQILRSYTEGIRFSNERSHCEIRMEEDGFLMGSSQRCSLTWMNGKINEWIATPRRGKPVEIQALWYNALQFASELCLQTEGSDHGWAEVAKKVRENFNLLFWNSQNNYLYDVIDGNNREGSIRPNALYAISLPYEVLEPSRFAPVLEVAARNLYTSLGLRTLSPSEPHFHGVYAGNERNRAAAEHNGTVVPFLVGSFLTAFFKTYGHDPRTKERAIHFLIPFVAHLADGGLGHFSEMFDGNPPHNPRGAVADARTVAEILRVMREEAIDL